MDSIPHPWGMGIEIVVIILIFLFLALLNAADKAIDAVSHGAIREMAEEGDRRAKRLVLIFRKPSNYMAAVKILMVFCGFVAGALLFHCLLPLFAKRLLWAGSVTGWLLLLLAAAALFCLLVVGFVIVLPRQLAIKHPEGVALSLSAFALFISRLCRPFVVLERGLASIGLRLAGQGGYQEEAEFSEDEVMSMLEVGQESGVIKEEGKKMIDSIFAFDDKLAYEIMTPRTDVFSIDLEDEEASYLEELMQMRYSRIPVYREDSDNIVGIINIKDFLIKARERGFENVDLEEILRDPFFVPDTKNIDSLFFELQKTKQHIAILIDEYGGFSGIVTMEDIIEEVMGEIDDEFDEEEDEIQELSYHCYRIDGNADLDDINEAIGTDLHSDYSETLGGLLIDLLGEIPEDGEERELRFDRYLCVIESVKDRRVERVRLTIRDEEDLKREAAQQEEEASGALETEPKSEE